MRSEAQKKNTTQHNNNPHTKLLPSLGIVWAEKYEKEREKSLKLESEVNKFLTIALWMKRLSRLYATWAESIAETNAIISSVAARLRSSLTNCRLMREPKRVCKMRRNEVPLTRHSLQRWRPASPKSHRSRRNFVSITIVSPWRWGENRKGSWEHDRQRSKHYN